MFKKLKIILFVASIYSFHSGFARENYIEWLPKHRNLRQRINLDSRLLEQEVSPGNWMIIRPVKINDQEIDNLRLKSSKTDYFFLTPHKVRFVIQGTGLVYDFDLISSTLKRMDQTIHSGYNFSATRFYRNNVLYSIGGEGFWSFNRHITYFDEKTSMEWEILRPKNKGPDMLSEGFQGYSPHEDAFYSGGSNNKNYLEDEKITFTKDFFRFNFKNNVWEFLGDISEKIPLKEHRTIYWTGTHFLQMARDRLYIIDPKKNEIYEYKDNSSYFEAGSDFYISDDTIKFHHFLNRGPLTILPILALLKKSSYVGKFYVTDYSPYYFAATFLILFLAVVFIINNSKRNHKPRFDELERKLLNALIDAGENYISTHELNVILECGNKSQENQRRIRFMTIKQVNEKLAYYYNIENIIERSASEEDKRLINYRLKRGVKIKIKSLL